MIKVKSYLNAFGVGALSVKMIKVIERAFSIETVFYALGLTSIILVGVIVVLIYKTR